MNSTNLAIVCATLIVLLCTTIYAILLLNSPDAKIDAMITLANSAVTGYLGFIGGKYHEKLLKSANQEKTDTEDEKKVS